MNIKTLAKWGTIGLAALLSVGFSGCGQQQLVSFGQYSGSYDGKTYSVAASTWQQQENEEGFDGVWKLTGTVKYDDKTGKTLYYGSADTQHFVAITVDAADGVTPQDPTFKVDERTLKPFDNGNDSSFTLVKAISESSKDFTLTINWNSQTSVKYKFVVDQSAFVLEEKPQ